MKNTSSRIGGDFDFDALEAFRAAYADQMSQPEDQDTDPVTGMPTNVVSNTSPWLEHTGLWKYPSGKGPEDDLKAGFNPEDFFSNEVVEGEEDIESLEETEDETEGPEEDSEEETEEE